MQDTDDGKARHITVVLKHQLLPQEIKTVSMSIHNQAVVNQVFPLSLL